MDKNRCNRYCQSPSSITGGNCDSRVFTDGNRCFRVCPYKLKRSSTSGVTNQEDSQGNSLFDSSCRSCGYKKFYLKNCNNFTLTPESEAPYMKGTNIQLDPTHSINSNSHSNKDSRYNMNNIDQSINEYQNVLLDEIQRKSKGTSAMYTDSFISYNDDIFFITAGGFKQSYIKRNVNDVHHPTCKEKLAGVENVTSKEFKSIRSITNGQKRYVGTPCGYENQVVGVKGEDGSYSKKGYVDQEGILNTILDNIPEDCPQEKIVDIPENVWGSFTIGKEIKKNGTCKRKILFEKEDDQDLIEKRDKFVHQLKQTIPKPKQGSSNNSQQAKSINMSTKEIIDSLGVINKNMEETQTSIVNFSAMQRVTDLYRKFYKWRYFIYIIGILILASIVYAFTRSTRNKSSLTSIGAIATAVPILSSGVSVTPTEVPAEATAEAPVEVPVEGDLPEPEPIEAPEEEEKEE